MTFADILARSVPSVYVDTSPQVLESHANDWSESPAGCASAIAFQADVEQVRGLVLAAARHGIPLVPSGGRTGLSGGAVAAFGEVVVSFDRMRRILDFNPMERTVTVEAGVVTQQVQDFAREQGLFYPVDFASSGSSQVGGNISTNAGGIKVIRHGMTRDWVAGLKLVTGNQLPCRPAAVELGDILRIQVDRIQEPPAGRAVRAVQVRVGGKQRVKRVEPDNVHAHGGGFPDEGDQIGKVPYAPVAIRSDTV